MTFEKVNFQFGRKKGHEIKVIGVGGGGGNAINHMFRLGIHDVDFIVCNTDSQALSSSPVNNKVQLGSSLTEGRGAGNKPEIGKQAAVENIEDVRKALMPDTKMVFITAGLGGGTGTGGAPVIAELCSQEGYLTVGIVTIPFRNEGMRRVRQAIEGIKEMEKYVDSLLVINNERIREMYGDFPISQAFAKADDILAIAAKGIAEIITVHGYINVDFADVHTVMKKSGVAVMGTGVAGGEGRALAAVEKALNSPLLNNNDIRGAKNILLNINSGDVEVTMDEIGEITDYIQRKAGNNADLIWGNGEDNTLGDQVSVTVIATGFSTSSIPEFFADNEQVKETHFLKETDWKEPIKPQPSLKPEPEKTPSKQEKEPVFKFSMVSHQPQKPEYELLYSKTGKEQTEPKKEMKKGGFDHSHLTDEEIEKLINVPAYVRKQMKSDQHTGLKSEEYSGISVSSDPGKGIIIREKNPYLNKKVD
jgi:cell division protein FtsZ